MSTELAVVNDKQLIGYLDNLGLASKLSEKEKSTYLEIAKAFGLNPFKREIHVSKYGENLSIITGYEVYIKRAERSGQLDGWEATTSGSVASGDLKATVTIWRKDRSKPFVWEAYYDECVQTTDEWVDGKKTGNKRPTSFWQKARFMTKKVAISQAFRLCFSDELGGMPYTADEMPQQEETIDTPHVEVIETDWAEAINECTTESEILEVWKLIPKDKRESLKEIASNRKIEIENGTK
jgi:phage recombination protein Bet